ncbi:MAG: hypothetical protein PHT88_01810 [Candidatus Moranbacteria bacterium]|nr:hypothetical protein [Candidatus Moranbacteria bacterium]
MKKDTKYPFVSFAFFSSMILLLPLISYSCYLRSGTSADAEEEPIITEAPTPSTDTLSAIPAEAALAAAPSNAPDTLVPGEAQPRAIETFKPLDLTGANDEQLKKLSAYQNALGGFVTNQLMVFVDMPQTSSGIKKSARYIAQTSDEFARHGVTPIFIFEPIDEKDRSLNLKKVAEGKYQKNLDQLFAEIQKSGAVEKNLGIFVPYPEANTSAWDRSDSSPEEFPAIFNAFFDTAKKYYPHIRGSILLDTKTYPINDNDWEHGRVQSFAPYLTGINPEHVSSFGLQGFPWSDEHLQGKDFDAHNFLPTSIATEAASILHTDTIWLNTGTFREMYTIGNSPVSADERAQIFQSILGQANALTSQGFKTWINIFAENKMAVDEKTDWSYLDATQNKTLSPHESALKKFIDDARGSGVALSLFDL